VFALAGGDRAERREHAEGVEHFAMTKSPDAATVTAGGAATYALAIRPVNGLTGNVTFACSGAPRGATCAVEPTSVELDGTSVEQLKVRVTTSGGAAALPMGGLDLGPLGRHGILPLLLMALLTLAVAAIYDRRKSQRKTAAHLQGRHSGRPLRWALLTATMLMLLAWASCGGGGLMSLGGGGTPAGRYALTVTGTYSSSTGPTPGTLSKSTSLNLKVN
jgi:hypothetical protein